LIAFVPHGPSWTLEPDLALALFVAPVLLDAAFDTSLRDLRNNWLPVAMLVFVAVGVTTAAVAVLAHWLRPDMPWAVAIALGAIVAPPDAAAAAAILRQVNLPYRILKILEGESLLNDASALLIYRVAVGAEATRHFSWSAFAPPVALALAGSLIAGYVFGRLSMLVTRRINEAPSAIIVQFAGTFTVWIVAERLGLSGILTIVAYAITIARTAPQQMPARLQEDHDNARLLACALRELPQIELDPALVETNIVIFHLRGEGDAGAFVSALASRGVLAGTVGRHSVRLVTHHDVDRAACERARDILLEELGKWDGR